MKEFNYQDYLKYEKLKTKEPKGALEASTKNKKYQYKVHQPHDKIFKIVLEEKKEVVGLLNRILQIKEKIKEEEIEKYDNEYINYMFQDSESDIVYKMKTKQIYFLIEHQSKIDYAMPKRILEYETGIISKAIVGKKMTKKDHKLPRVIPIVIYTGSRKWDVEKYIEECQEKLTKSEQIKLGSYYVLDVNDYTKEELEKDKFFLSTMMLLEKINTEKELVEELNKVIEKEKKEKNRDFLRRLIRFVLKEKINLEDREKLLKKLEMEGEDMISEVLRKENERQRREGRKEGRKEGIQEITKNLLKLGIDIEDIKKATGLSQKELQNLAQSNN